MILGIYSPGDAPRSFSLMRNSRFAASITAFYFTSFEVRAFPDISCSVFFDLIDVQFNLELDTLSHLLLVLGYVR